MWGQKVSLARDGFTTQLKLVDQLITIHGKLQSGQGRRYEQDALHRAGVVITVAAWQAYIEKIVMEAINALQPAFTDLANPAPAWAVHTYEMRRTSVYNLTKKFNTPDDVRVRDLIRDVTSYNVWDCWQWKSKSRKWDSGEVRRRTNGWVLIRHSVAHGFSLPTELPWLNGTNGAPSLNLARLKECKKHFTHLVDQTDAAIADHLVQLHNIARPWN